MGLDRIHTVVSIKRMNEPDTRSRLLDAAERLFAEEGFAGVGLRAITAAAGANLAAVNYHFGSKEGLLHAVLERRITPLNAEHMARLAALEDQHRAGPLPLEGLLRALLEPLAHHPVIGDRSHFGRLLSRVYIHQDDRDQMEPMLNELSGDIRRRFVMALRVALPHLDVETFFYRGAFLSGAMWAGMAQLDAQAACVARSGEDWAPQRIDAQRAIEELIRFCHGGLLAAASSAEEQGHA